MEDYKYITGDQAMIINQISNHPYELKTTITILGQEENSHWKVTDNKETSIVSSLDLFPINY